MINSVQYKMLKSLENGEPIDYVNYKNDYLSLRRRGYITIIDNENALGGEWRTVMEEYEQSLQRDAREQETLKTAKRANAISIISLIISAVSIIASVLIGIML